MDHVRLNTRALAVVTSEPAPLLHGAQTGPDSGRDDSSEPDVSYAACHHGRLRVCSSGTTRWWCSAAFDDLRDHGTTVDTNSACGRDIDGPSRIETSPSGHPRLNGLAMGGGSSGHLPRHSRGRRGRLRSGPTRSEHRSFRAGGSRS